MLLSLQHEFTEITRIFVLITHTLLFDITEVKRSYDYIISRDYQTSHMLYVLLPFAVHDSLAASERILPKEKRNNIQ